MMNRVSCQGIVVILLSLGFLPSPGAEIINTDICIYGGTASGVASAVEVSRSGKTAVIVEFGNHLGGMSSGGLGQTDIGNKAAIGGISREFYQRVGKHYGKTEQWTFEPGVAERVFLDMVKDSKAQVRFRQRLLSVKKEGARIVEITMEDGTIYRAAMFIDASYEGDLMARANVSCVIGREPNSKYGETLNGIRAQTPKHQFLVSVDPYVKPGDPASGLLPLIQSGDTGIPGTGDDSVQAYNFRLCLTRNPHNKLPITPPADYDASRYELLARYIEAQIANGKQPKLGDLIHIQPMPNGKTDINNDGPISTDFIGASYEYPAGDYARREQLRKAHEDYTRGFFHFLSTSPRVPRRLRDETASWGLAADEFRDTAGWPHQLYIRETRRMVSDYVMTELNCRNSLKLPDSIALAAYTMDSHNCRRIARNGRVENEGDTQVGGFPPYPIAYRAIIPKSAECENLLVPVCLSSSHIAYGSIRMEPVFMVLGQSAAAAACQAIDEHLPVQKIDVGELQKKLLNEHQILDWIGNPPGNTAK